MKWNDHCVYLFWDMLLIAVFYLKPDMVESVNREEVALDIECFAIFLVLHMAEHHAKSTGVLSGPNFDSVWPLNADGEVYPSSPVHSPNSPNKDQAQSRVHRAASPIGSPRDIIMSPRSSRDTMASSKASSPGRKSGASSPRTPRLNTHHLLSVRQKIPTILRVLNWEEDITAADNNALMAADDPSKLESLSQSLRFNIERRIADFVGMILCGGLSRDQNVRPLLL